MKLRTVDILTGEPEPVSETVLRRIAMKYINHQNVASFLLIQISNLYNAEIFHTNY